MVVNAPNLASFDYSLFYENRDTNHTLLSYSNCTLGNNVIYEIDPQLDTYYKPIWNATVKSPCIDVGYGFDDDDTPADLGAIPAVDHKYDLIELPPPAVDSGWKWLSFPALDVVLNDADIAENVLADILNPNILDYVLSQDYLIDYNPLDQTWSNDWKQFLRTEGFKFKMLAAAEFEVIGFKIADNTPVSLTGEDEDNWVGYWIEETQSVSDAFSDYWDGENIHYIQHQYWTATYYMDTWWYQCQGGHLPTISYGEMVNIHCNDNITSFRWDNSTPEEQRMMIPKTEYYSFEETENYTPIYITLDETNLPTEVGAFVNGECVGASIVTDQLCQLNAYTGSTAPGNVELELYYGSRSSNSPVRLSNYNCQNTLEPNCIQRQINTTINPEAWFVTLGDDSQTVNSIQEFYLDNYPNPFNPTTTISYNIPHEGKVFLEIYNIKGQLVKQLVSGSQPEGYYEVIWNGKNDVGKHVASGIYYCRVTACGKTRNKKMLMLK
ncbi:MAG: T9SS type A sorting domain-containing protein [Candidatus Cloacimonetes bacterium]|nr:T9SS type A sorting domain-containing protein [Candidatus Cloacimonadota bacterium]MCF7814924.1 T9SS type A sorting domain-containing protein [Candidatus Cloacimonadota bacterium]